ncbi:MAG: AlpA family phage regulatory protein [Acidimicrobiia bacterium]|nr:AlpA family phage regulatory protein [Acidimicrobiia bacterium]
MPSLVGGRVVRLPEVLEITGLSRTTIWRRERDGSFPPPIRLGGEHTRGWAGGNRTSTTGSTVCLR